MFRKNGLFKKICLVASILVLAVLTSGCGTTTSSTAKPKVITIWGFDDPDVWKPVIKEALKADKGFNINYVQKTLDSNYEVNSLNSIMSGNGPDVWALPSDSVYRHKDQLASMPATLSKALNLDNAFVPAIKSNGVFDNKIYSLSPVVDTLMVYYNPTIFSQAQEEYNANKDLTSEQKKVINNALSGNGFPTWTTLVQASNLITKKSGATINRSGIAIGTSNNVSRADDLIYALMLQNGTKMTSDNIDTATFNLPTDANPAPGKASLDFLRSFSDPNSANYSWNSSLQNDIAAFASGQTAMIINYGSLSRYFAQKFPDLKYKRTSLPQLTSDATAITDYASYTTFAVPNKSLYPTESWQVINALIGNASSDYTTAVGVSSSAKKNNFTANISDRNTNNPGAIQAQTAKVWNKGRYPLDIDKLFSSMIQSVADGQGASQSALDLASTKSTDLFRKSSW